MKHNIFFAVTVITLGILIFLVFQLPARLTTVNQKVNPLNDEVKLDYAHTLLAKGLNEQAALVFADYIDTANINAKEQAKICYRLGKVYMDLYNYEKALAYFYRAEILDKNAPFMPQMNEEVVAALEHLGMSEQARYELSSRVSLGQDKKEEGKVVARIGKRKITDTEINRQIDSMPEWFKKSLTESGKRAEFIREYVTQEVLYAKAKRLGLDKKEQVRRLIDSSAKQLIVNTLLSEQVEDLEIAPDDIEMYYKANKDKYTEPEKIKIKYVSFDKEEDKDSFLEKIEDNQNKELKEALIARGESYISGIGQAKEVIEDLFLMEKGQRSDIRKIGDKFYIFKIVEKIPQRTKTFDQVKSQVEYEYRAKKQQQKTQEFLANVMQEQEVEILYDAPNAKAKNN